MKLLFYISLFTLISCNQIDGRFSCGLAPSSPTELIIHNDSSIEIELELYVKMDSYKSIAKFKLEPNEQKSICIENEGEIIQGLYFDYNGKKTMIKLKSQRLNKFNLNSRTHEYERFANMVYDK
jgi:hypothetical protein